MSKTLTGERFFNLLVDYNVHADSSLGGGLQHAVETVLLVLCWRTSQV
jgi:hypothetical protein